MNDIKVYKCMHCKKIVEVITKEVAAIPTICCGTPMVEMKANSTDAATEKHVPVVEVDGKVVNVTVGSTIHPMTEEHLISFIILVTDKGIYRRDLTKDDEPKATFVLGDETPLKVYEYCNLHGLWVKEL